MAAASVTLTTSKAKFRSINNSVVERTTYLCSMILLLKSPLWSNPRSRPFCQSSFYRSQDLNLILALLICGYYIYKSHLKVRLGWAMIRNYIYINMLFSITLSCSHIFAADPGFSLHNKAHDEIKIELINGGTKLTGTVQPDKFENFQIDTARETALHVLYIRYDQIGSKKIAVSKTEYAVKFAANKTIYINFNPNIQSPIYPQKGPFLGITNKTDLGYSTKNNIVASQILPDPQFRHTIVGSTPLQEVSYTKL
jgi:hypothetical protein